MIQHGLNYTANNLIIFTGEILRGLRHNYVAEALRMTFCSLSVNCYVNSDGLHCSAQKLYYRFSPKKSLRQLGAAPSIFAFIPGMNAKMLALGVKR